jgi:hypothetical protein
MSRSPEHDRLTRVALAVFFLIVAVAWPIVEIGPRGPVLFTMARAQGVVASDLLALIPLALAILVLRPLLRRPP